MRFEDALKAMRDGKRVRRAVYVVGLSLRIHDNAFVAHPGGERWDGVSRGDLLADDWEVSDEPARDFAWALEQLKLGRGVARHSKPPYWVIQPGAHNTITYEDMIATDWRLG